MSPEEKPARIKTLQSPFLPIYERRPHQSLLVFIPLQPVL